MGLFNAIFSNRDRQKAADAQAFFQAFTAYSPVFSSWEGSIFEMELTRAAIHAFASFCSKLKPEVKGTAYRSLEKTLQFRPNPFMSASQFLYRVAVILSVDNNAFVVPIEDEYGSITGYFPVLPANCEVMDIGGEAYLRYTFANGKRAAIEYARVGHLTSHQFRDDFFGTDNSALRPTMQVIHAQNRGIIEGIKNSAAIRFLAKIARTIKDDDVNRARASFAADNLGAENHGGVLVYDGRFEDVKPIDSKPLNVNPGQMKLIMENVFNYFGVNEAILQNKYTEDEYNAFYQGKVEPFALQLSLAMSNMTFTDREMAFGNKIVFAMNHVHYASNSTKLQMATQMFDRGLMSRNMVMDMWNFPHVEDGDKFYIRKEYSQIDKLHDDPGDGPQEEAPDVQEKSGQRKRGKVQGNPYVEIGGVV